MPKPTYVAPKQQKAKDKKQLQATNPLYGLSINEITDWINANVTAAQSVKDALIYIAQLTSYNTEDR